MDRTLDISDIQILRHFPRDAGGMFWHQRVLLRKVGQGIWIGLSPDMDREVLNLNKITYKLLERNSAFPADIVAEVYGFDPLSRGDLEKEKRLAKLQGSLLDDADPEEVVALIWICSDPTSEKFGTEVSANEMRDAVTLGHLGSCEVGDSLEPIAQMAASEVPAFKERKQSYLSDIRLLGDHRNAQGKRYLRFEKGLEMLRETAFKDWPFTGPRAVLEFLTSVREGSGNLMSYHLQWSSASGVNQFGAAAHEHKCLCEVLRKAIEVDQLDISNLTSFEEAVRRIIQIEVAVARNPQQPDYSGLDELLESPVGSQGQASTTKVTHWLTDRLKDKANIQKQARLFREECGRGGGGGNSRGRETSGPADGKKGGRKGGRKGKAPKSGNETAGEQDA